MEGSERALQRRAAGENETGITFGAWLGMTAHAAAGPEDLFAIGEIRLADPSQ